MGVWREKTPRGIEIKSPDPGPVNPAGSSPGVWGRSGKRPPDNPAGGSTPRRLRKPKAS